MKMQLTPRFPVSVVGVPPVSVSIVNGVLAVSIATAEPTVFNADGVIANQVGSVAVVRNNPAVTNLQLPSVQTQSGVALLITDWSTNVVNHQIILTPAGAETIKRLGQYSIFSNAAELGAAILYPSKTLNGWIVR